MTELGLNTPAIMQVICQAGRMNSHIKKERGKGSEKADNTHSLYINFGQIQK